MVKQAAARHSLEPLAFDGDGNAATLLRYTGADLVSADRHFEHVDGIAWVRL